MSGGRELPIRALGLSAETTAALRFAGKTTVGDVLTMTAPEILALPGFPESALDQVLDALIDLGLAAEELARVDGEGGA